MLWIFLSATKKTPQNKSKNGKNNNKKFPASFSTQHIYLPAQSSATPFLLRNLWMPYP